MRLSSDIKKAMQYPSVEVKIRCMHEAARYLRDAYNCGSYSEALKKLTSSKYYFGIDTGELMELLTGKYNCSEICEKARLLKKMYMELLKIEIDGDYRISGEFVYRFVCEQVIGKQLDYKNLTAADIDSYTKDIDMKKLPGALYPLVQMVHNEEVLLYIYTAYALPALIRLSESREVSGNEALCTIMLGCMEQLVTFAAGEGGIFITRIPSYTTWNDVIMEFQRTGEFDCIRRAAKRLNTAKGIGIQLLTLHKLNKDWLSSRYQSHKINYFPMFCALVMFALIAEERNKEAVEYMIDNYADISEDNCQCAYVLIVLFKSILLADSYEYMNILYADLQKEKLLYQRNFKDINNAIIQACVFIEEMYNKISSPLEETCFEYLRLFIKETVFEEWGMLEDIRDIRKQYHRAHDHVKVDMFLRVYDVIRALSNSEGINVALLGQTYGRNFRETRFIREKHHDDKVAMVISWDDADRAGKLLKDMGDVDKGASSVRNRSFFERVDIVIKDILLEKLDNDIQSMLQAISELRGKTDYLNREDEFFTAIEPHIISLTKRISAKYIDRNRVTDYFIELDGNKGCWERLDEECRNMMLTSEIVYRTMIARDDADKLDYSPSMIPLTKVIEYLLNDIYGRLKHNIVFDGPGMNIDASSAKHFKDIRTNGPKESIEMGPAVKMLSDGFLKLDEYGKLFYKSFYLWPKRYRFSEWQGDRYVDWGLLMDFKGIRLNCSGFEANSPVSPLVLGNNTEFNRKIFIGALEYIKNCYRNKVAHKDGIDRPRMEECREDMLIAQKLIWMLVYIIR